TLAERARRRLTCAADLRRDQERHAAELARRDTAWARFADYAGTHRFGLRDLDKQGEALRTFESRLTRLAGELGVLAARQEALQAAEAVLAQREQAWQAVAAEVADVESSLRQERVRLATAEQAVGT